MFHTLEVDPDRDMGMPVHDPVLVTDLHHQRVELDHRVERLQPTVLPRGDLGHHRFGHIRDRLMRQLGAQRGRSVVPDLMDRHLTGIQADDLILHPRPNTDARWAPAWTRTSHYGP